MAFLVLNASFFGKRNQLLDLNKPLQLKKPQSPNQAGNSMAKQTGKLNTQV